MLGLKIKEKVKIINSWDYSENKVLVTLDKANIKISKKFIE